MKSQGLSRFRQIPAHPESDGISDYAASENRRSVGNRAHVCTSLDRGRCPVRYPSPSQWSGPFRVRPSFSVSDAGIGGINRIGPCLGSRHDLGEQAAELNVGLSSNVQTLTKGLVKCRSRHGFSRWRPVPGLSHVVTQWANRQSGAVLLVARLPRSRVKASAPARLSVLPGTSPIARRTHHAADSRWGDRARNVNDLKGPSWPRAATVFFMPMPCTAKTLQGTSDV